MSTLKLAGFEDNFRAESFKIVKSKILFRRYFGFFLYKSIAGIIFLCFSIIFNHLTVHIGANIDEMPFAILF